MNIVYVYADTRTEWCCSEYRMAIFARAINGLNRGRDNHAELLNLEEFANATQLANGVLESANVIVVQRNFFGPVLQQITRWKLKGKLLIADFDDDFSSLPPDNSAWPHWALNFAPTGNGATAISRPSFHSQFLAGIQLCHAFTTPSEYLTSKYVGLTGKAGYTLPNLIEYWRWAEAAQMPPRPNLEGTAERDYIAIGYPATLSHFQSMINSGILTALGAIFQKHPAVRIVLSGSDEMLAAVLPIDPARIVRRPWVSYQDWAAEMRQYDILIAPLAGEFDQSRGQNKALEGVAVGLPVIASKGEPYKHLADKVVLVDNSTDAWFTALDECISHFQERYTQARALRQWAATQSADVNAYRIVNKYIQIANDCKVKL